MRKVENTTENLSSFQIGNSVWKTTREKLCWRIIFLCFFTPLRIIYRFFLKLKEWVDALLSATESNANVSCPLKKRKFCFFS